MSDPLPPDPAQARRPDAPSRTALVGALIASALAVVAATSDAMFFVNDGPQHLFASVAALGVDEARAFDHYVSANLSPTGRGVTDVIQTLTPLIGWRAAYRAAVAVTVLTWGWGFFALAAVLAPRRALVGWLGFAFALQTPLFLGLLPFVLASGLALIAAAAFLSAAPPRRRLAAAALGLGCAAHVHVAAAAIAGATLAVVTIAGARARGASLARVVRELAVVGTWPLLVAVLVWWMSRDLDTGLVAGAPVALLERARMLPSMFLLGGLEPWLGAGLLLVVAAVVGAGPARVARDSWALIAAGGFWLGVAALVPSSFAGWGGAGDRTIPFGFACLFLATPIELLGARARVGAAIAIVALALGVHARVRDVQQHILALHAPLLDAVETLPTAPRYWYAISARATGPHADGIPAPLDPALHAGQLAALGLGGYVEDSHAVSRALHAARVRPEVTRHPSSDPLGGNYFAQLSGDVSRDLSLAPRVAGLAAPFDGVLLYGPSPMSALRDALGAFGFHPLVEAGGLTALAFAPCDYQLVVDGGAPLGQLAWELGPGEVPYASVRYLSATDASGVARASIRTLCGDVWVRPVDGRCAGAGGVARARGDRDGPAALHCTVARR